MSPHLFVAGTDTGIGKTHSAQALVYAFAQAGERVAGMKPIASGCDATPEGLRNDDALALCAASVPPPPYERVNPLAFPEAVAPHLAAERAGVQIAWPPLDNAFAALRAGYQRVVVEGVGGWMVPLAPGLSSEHIPVRWGLPVVLVVGMRLGCISHARLTARAILADGCELAGWIANIIEPGMPLLDENIATLRDCLPAPCLGVLPYGMPPAQAASRLQITRLA